MMATVILQSYYCASEWIMVFKSTFDKLSSVSVCVTKRVAAEWSHSQDPYGSGMCWSENVLNLHPFKCWSRHQVWKHPMKQRIGPVWLGWKRNNGMIWHSYVTSCRSRPVEYARNLLWQREGSSFKSLHISEGIVGAAASPICPLLRPWRWRGRCAALCVRSGPSFLLAGWVQWSWSALLPPPVEGNKWTPPCHFPSLRANSTEANTIPPPAFDIKVHFNFTYRWWLVIPDSVHLSSAASQGHRASVRVHIYINMSRLIYKIPSLLDVLRKSPTRIFSCCMDADVWRVRVCFVYVWVRASVSGGEKWFS